MVSVIISTTGIHGEPQGPEKPEVGAGRLCVSATRYQSRAARGMGVTAVGEYIDRLEKQLHANEQQ